METTIHDLKALWFLTRVNLRHRCEMLHESRRWKIITVMITVALSAGFTVNYRLFASVFEAASRGSTASAPEVVLALPLAAGAVLGLILGTESVAGFRNCRCTDFLLTLPLGAGWMSLMALIRTWPLVLGTYAYLVLPSAAAYALIVAPWPAVPIYLAALPAASLAVTMTARACVALLGSLFMATRPGRVTAYIKTVFFIVLYAAFIATGDRLSVDGAREGLLRLVEIIEPAWLSIPALAVTWPAATLHLINTADPSAGWGILLAGSLGCLAAASLLGRVERRPYSRFLSRARGAPARTRPRRRGDGAILLRGARSQLGALLSRDWIVLTRGPVVWVTMLTTAGAVAILFRGTWARSPATHDPLTWGCLAAAAAALFASQFSPRSFICDLSSFYHTSTLPVQPRLRVLSRMIVFTVPAALAGVAMAALALGGTGSPGDLARAAALVVSAAAAATAVGMQSALQHTDFDADSPEQALTIRTGLSYLYVTLIIMLLAYALLVFIVSVVDEYTGLSRPTAETIGTLTTSAVLLFSVVPSIVDRTSQTLQRRAPGTPSMEPTEES